MSEIGLGIVSGRYPQNSILPGDAELMEQFGVSRTVLREAMKTLAGKGLIIAKARIGTRVRDRAEWNLFDPDVLIWHAKTGFDREFLSYLAEMRMALEPEAAVLAARRATPECILALRNWVGEMGREGISADDFVVADLNLHLAIARAAGNPFLSCISTLIEVALVTSLAISSPIENRTAWKSSVAAHAGIVEAIAAGDQDGAREAMRVVIRQGTDRIGQSAP
ncbi:FadR family transcriptional regulator [Arsenicitalea aurantiaca]|uniref:FadR family transcriptional regulator n=2 Tax=Arsenicitalea aurantiaca TaxID=1783274 RepID=A0A433XGN9_9HYPH|nr:FadR family transcriptional regulator [Arsenicitalea aurantiaca]